MKHTRTALFHLLNASITLTALGLILVFAVGQDVYDVVIKGSDKFKRRSEA